MNLLFGGAGSTRVGDIGILLLRLSGALICLGHGWSKMFGPNRFGPPQQFIDSIGNMAFPAPTLFAWSAALAEFLGGALIALGLLTRPAALALSFNMIVAAFGAHYDDPFFSQGGPSKEFALVYATTFLPLIFLGAGRYSADRLLYRS